jgi:hypothetical protein
MKTTKTILLTSIVLVSMGLAGAYGGQANLSELKTLTLQKTDRSLEVVIEIVGEFNYMHFELEDPSRLILEFSPIGDIKAKPDYVVDAIGVQNIRVRRYTQTAARVSFNLAEKMPAYDISRVATGVRVVFLADRTAKPPPPPSPVKKKEEPEKEAPRPVSEEAHLRSVRYERIGQQIQVLIDATGTFSYNSQVINNNRRLAIDFFPIQKLSARSISDIDVFGLKRIEVNQTEAETVRIALDYTDALPAFAITRVESGVKILLSAPEPAEKEPVREEPRRKRWEPYPPLNTTILSFLGGMYSVSDELFKEIYGGSGMIYGAELNQVVLSSDNHNFALMLGFRSFSKTGALTETQEETKLSLTPLSLGLRYLYNLKQVALFIGGGVDFLSYKEENVIADVSGSTTGFHAMGGFFFKFPGVSALHIMGYAKYTSATATENEIEIALGGIEAGLGLSLGFNLF